VRCALALACCAALLGGATPAAASTPWRAAGPAAPLTSLAFANVAGSARVYAGSARHWWRSDDDGGTWTPVAGGPYPGGPACQLRASPANPDVLYTGCGSVSLDAGAHWTYIAAIGGAPQIDGAGTLYWIDANNSRSALHRCTPDGASCVTITIPESYGLLVDPASAGLLVNEPGGGGFSVSSDGGATWSAARTLPADVLQWGLSFDGRVPGKLIALGQNSTPARVMSVSPDAGLTWSPRRVLPLAHESTDDLTALAGGSGSARRTWLQGSHDAAWTSDDGATFHVVHTPFLYGGLTVDPNDGTHVFLGDGTRLLESRDAGATWALRNSLRFGALDDTRAPIAGSGSTLYALRGGVAFVSGDAGLTWTIPGELLDVKLSGLVASRDDPRIAYAYGATATSAGFWRTVDGGLTWQARTVPPAGTFSTVGWVESGHPDWVFMGETGSLPITASHDGGQTWFSIPIESMCLFVVTIPGSQSRGTASCGPLLAVNPLRPPWAQAFDAVEYVQLDAGSGIMVATSVLGRVNADWSFSPACSPLSRPGACGQIVSYSGVSTDAWIGGGHVTYAYSDGQSVWAEPEGGRWWRLAAPAGSEASTGPAPVLLLSHSQLIANGLSIPLQAPDVGVPTLTLVSGPLHCTTTVPADVADLTYVWRRDGAVIAGTAADHVIVPADEGHALGCTATASNAWGATTASSGTFRVAVTGAAGERRRLTLTGTAGVGSLLRCGATRGIGWLRGATLLKGLHGRTYRVLARDEGHALACQSHPAGEPLARSAAVRIPAPHGGRAALVSVSP
jgi:hypothetical protein